MAVDLRFWRAVTTTPGAVELRFADAPTQTDVTGSLAATLPAAQPPALALAATGDSYVLVTGTLSASLPPPTLSLTLDAIEAPVGVTIDATLPAPILPALELAALGEQLQAVTLAATFPAPQIPALSLDAAVTYDSALPDAVGPRTAPRHASALAISAGLAAHQQAMLAAHTPGNATHAQALPLAIGARPRDQGMLPAQRPLNQRHQHGGALASALRPRHADHERARRALRQRHQSGLAAAAGSRPRHAEQIRTRQHRRADHQSGLPLNCAARTAAHNGLPTSTRRSVRHQQAIPLPVGMWRPDPGVEPPVPNPYSSPVHLLFWRLNDGTTNLRFGNRPPAPGVVIPVPEYYFVINTVTFVRADTGAPVAARQFSASIDVDSWTWSWSATLPITELGAVKSPALGEQFELIATLNGSPLRLVVEKINRDRRFGDGRVRVSGLGRAAWLADPYAAVETRSNAQARTARQLLEDALTTNGVSIGWTVDWRITDWLVPAGAWSHQGTYKDAANRIAEAGGAYVQGHDTEQTLIVLPRYPAAPWAWASLTPDLELPEDVVEVEGIEWTDRPAYNAVYVTGGSTGGRHDRILRTGTAADRIAPQIVDSLATAPEMTRQRGLAALADTGRQARITLRLPVLPETGLITPGKLIRYVESGTSRLGLSRAIEVSHDFPQLWQTIQVETHELEPV
ncbi:hypothetical protein SAMN05421829_108173 [Aromatoleum tolulyticum]|uniref:Uncharacterized protein n=1 Tax=Aromatoleum tolulyticum TaxID=34027 RepID=A0A1N6X324_9RHOO|nr:hypothetical protein [Aromatoleum tolulyticum]SIQ96758.1 hypothetical protein SAMN05421829_108173 [Aromatoleum tolulyticum]